MVCILLSLEIIKFLFGLGSPVPKARVMVENIKKAMVTTSRGEYWRLLSPGKYKLVAEDKDGTRRSKYKSLTVSEGTSVQIVNFVLEAKHKNFHPSIHNKSLKL